MMTKIRELERVGVGNFPTPFERMANLEAQLRGPRLFVKREDLTGLAGGGNKVRILDYVLTEPKREKADVLITSCGLQSNWARQVIGAAIRLGMKSVVLLRTAQFKRKPRIYDGNMLLDCVMGADIRVLRMEITEDPTNELREMAEDIRRNGHRPYILYDSYRFRATAGYANGMQELSKQARAAGISLDAVVVACGSGSTFAGLTLGAKMLGMKTRVIGVNIGGLSKTALIDTIMQNCEGAAKLLKSRVRLSENDLILVDNYRGRGYGITTKESIQALKFVARLEALLLDPVYSAKAMAGLIDLAKREEFRHNDNVCFIHTGGLPALFAYKSYFQPGG